MCMIYVANLRVNTVEHLSRVVIFPGPRYLWPELKCVRYWTSGLDVYGGRRCTRDPIKPYFQGLDANVWSWHSLFIRYGRNMVIVGKAPWASGARPAQISPCNVMWSGRLPALATLSMFDCFNVLKHVSMETVWHRMFLATKRKMRPVGCDWRGNLSRAHSNFTAASSFWRPKLGGVTCNCYSASFGLCVLCFDASFQRRPLPAKGNASRFIVDDVRQSPSGSGCPTTRAAEL